MFIELVSRGSSDVVFKLNTDAIISYSINTTDTERGVIINVAGDQTYHSDETLESFEKKLRTVGLL